MNKLKWILTIGMIAIMHMAFAATCVFGAGTGDVVIATNEIANYHLQKNQPSVTLALANRVNKDSEKTMGRDSSFCDFLMRKSVFFLADNFATLYLAVNERTFPYQMPNWGNMTAWGKLIDAFHPGICGFGYLDEKGLRDKTAVLQILKDGKVVELKPDLKRYQWYPDHAHQEFAGEVVRISQDTSIFEDVVLCRMTVEGLSPGNEIIVSGKSISPGDAHTHGQLLEVLLSNPLKGLTQWFGTTLEHAEITTSAAQNTNGWAETLFRMRASVPAGQSTLAFALATTVDADGTKAKVKLQAQLGNPGDYARRAREKWENYFKNEVPFFTCDDAKLMDFYYWVFCTMRINKYNVLEGDARPSYVCPSKTTDWCALAWDEDSSHIVIGMRWFNDPADLQMAEQMILWFSRPNAPFNYGLLTIAAWEVFKRTGNNEFLREYLTKEMERDKAVCDPKNGHICPHTGLIRQSDSFLVGWDNSVRYGYGGRNKNLHKLETPIETVDLNTYWVRQAQLMAEMANVLGNTPLAEQMKAKADARAKKVQEMMWDESTGFYYDVFADTHEKLFCKTCCGFFPLLAGIPSTAQSERLVSHLKNPKEFYRPFMVATISMDYPIQERSCWSGGVAGRNNGLIEEGLMHYRRLDMSSELVFKSIELFTHHDVPRACIYGHPNDGNCGYDFMTTDCAGALDMLIKRIVGFVPEADSAFTLCPTALNREWSHLRWGPFHYKGHEVEICWDKAEGYSLIWDGKTAFTDPSGGACKTFEFGDGGLKEHGGPCLKK